MKKKRKKKKAILLVLVSAVVGRERLSSTGVEGNLNWAARREGSDNTFIKARVTKPARGIMEGGCFLKCRQFTKQAS